MAGAPMRLRCEYLENPIGLGETQPILSWWLNDDRAAEVQTAYHVLAASAPRELEDDQADVWDSGRVPSSETAQIAFGGGPLVSMQRVWWKVRSYDSDGVASEWSAPACFEMGLLDVRDWRAHWIGTPLMGSKGTPARVPLLRRSFELPQRVERARLYITALGVYDVEINGQRAIDAELPPGWTDFRKRVRYQSYDVTERLRVGENVIGVWLGDGWYCGFLGPSERQQYGERPALLAQLEVILADGTPLVIATDGDWHWQQSELLYADLIDGESVDARQRQEGFTTRGFDSSGWLPVELVNADVPRLEADAGPRIRVLEEIEGSLVRSAPGELGTQRWLYDLGENIVGRIRLSIKAQRGTALTVRYAERLQANDDLYTENLRGARATDFYTCAGDEQGEVFEPRFTVHGFQYVEVSGRLRDGAIEQLTGVVLSSALPRIGEFSCDQQLVNQLQRNIARSQRGNFLDIPTDCPQRDERLGWTGDAQIFARTAAFNLDVSAFFAKWLDDIRDAQTDAGVVPPVAPLPPELLQLHIDGGPAWSDAIVICPWTVYRCCGDRRILERNYAAMAAFIANLEERFPDLIRGQPGRESWHGFGDWLALDGTHRDDSRAGGTPRDLIGTAFFCYTAKLLARIAGVLGNLSDLERYEELAQRIRTAFRRRFVTQDGRVAGETQTGYVLALHFGLLDAAERPVALDALVRNIEDRGGALSTGFVGTPYLLHALTQNGRLDLAYDLLLRTDAPGWLYPITQGATSIWERWDGWTRRDGFQDPAMNSFNHYALGAVGEWLYGVLLGLDVDPDLAPTRNAYRSARIQPRPPIGERFDGEPPIRRAQGSLETLYGRYEVAWQLTGAEFTLDVLVPPNCRATVILPDDTVHEVAAGRHDFRVPLISSVEDGIPVLQEVTKPASKAG